ncbi:hypothetical protein TNCT_89851 [Trichonephila clavata]|uniref:Uncharacterized protein n=1 Tax=Trichonephila clavata TaxID=2740835 RepID=A0A8X6GJ14_TRICU|nr:hypothetical protein TNCT_89851 [Trichonephila clavata]
MARDLLSRPFYGRDRSFDAGDDDVHSVYTALWSRCFEGLLFGMPSFMEAGRHINQRAMTKERTPWVLECLEYLEKGR